MPQTPRCTPGVASRRETRRKLLERIDAVMRQGGAGGVLVQLQLMQNAKCKMQTRRYRRRRTLRVAFCILNSALRRLLHLIDALEHLVEAARHRPSRCPGSSAAAGHDVGAGRAERDLFRLVLVEADRHDQRGSLERRFAALTRTTRRGGWSPWTAGPRPSCASNPCRPPFFQTSLPSLFFVLSRTMVSAPRLNSTCVAVNERESNRSLRRNSARSLDQVGVAALARP